MNDNEIGWMKHEEGVRLVDTSGRDVPRPLLTLSEQDHAVYAKLIDSDTERIRQIMREELVQATTTTCTVGECKEAASMLLLHYLKPVGFVRIPLCEQHYQASEAKS